MKNSLDSDLIVLVVSIAVFFAGLSFLCLWLTDGFIVGHWQAELHIPAPFPPRLGVDWIEARMLTPEIVDMYLSPGVLLHALARDSWLYYLLFPSLLIGTSYPEIHGSPNVHPHKTILLQEARNMVERRQTMKNKAELITLIVFFTGFFVTLGFVCVCLADIMV